MDERLRENCKHCKCGIECEPCATCLTDAIRYGVRRAWQPRDEEVSDADASEIR
jgi:hypothetical protein